MSDDLSEPLAGTSAEPATPPLTGRRKAFRALRHRNYQLFFVGQLISLIGTWMQQTAVSWLVYSITGSPFLLGLLGFMSQIPSFVVTLSRLVSGLIVAFAADVSGPFISFSTISFSLEILLL